MCICIYIHIYIYKCLVGGFNPFQKYARQIGSFPHIGMNIKKYLKPPPRYVNIYIYMYIYTIIYTSTNTLNQNHFGEVPNPTPTLGKTHHEFGDRLVTFL